MEAEGIQVMKLNIGNIAAFGIEPPADMVEDIIRDLPKFAGYTDSKGLVAGCSPMVSAGKFPKVAMPA
jgi:alanine-synthesizing transaminase